LRPAAGKARETEMEANRYAGQELRAFAAAVLERLGVGEDDAFRTADSLIRADLEGHASHGISRLLIYARRLAQGRINPNPHLTYERKGAVLLVDGDNGIGQAVAFRALQAAYPVADELGVAAVFIRASNHFGTAAYFCQEAAGRGYASIVTTNSPPGIAPWGGKQAFLGTNPIAFGFPAEAGAPPIVADLSSSVAARGKIISAHQLGRPIPEGWALDSDGRPTTDAAAALQGSLVPLGGAKGYALALAIEMLSGVLAQAAVGPHVGNLYREEDGWANIGHMILLFRIWHWLEPETYFRTVRTLVEQIKAVPIREGAERIWIPGERRFHSAAVHETAGVPVPDRVRRELVQWGERCGVPFPPPLAGPGDGTIPEEERP